MTGKVAPISSPTLHVLTDEEFHALTDLPTEYEERAQAGQIVEVSEIKAAYEEKVGHRIGGGQIYRVLKRHDWRKVKPRSEHPKKASAEAIDASKKLTWRSEKKNIRLQKNIENRAEL